MSYNEALKLEVTILEALLQRNQSSHSKTKYFQRTSMVLRSLHRYKLLLLSTTLETWKQSVLDRKQLLANAKATAKRKRETEQWDLTSIQNDITSQPTTESLLLDDSLQITLSSIQQNLQIHLPEVLSRIQYASQPLFLEISRGFFLPFCTVALAALARIRVLLMRCGHDGLSVVQDVQYQIEEEVGGKTNRSSKFFDENDLFLTPETVVNLRTIFTERNDSEAPSTVRREKRQKLKQSLGFMEGKSFQQDIIGDNDTVTMGETGDSALDDAVDTTTTTGDAVEEGVTWNAATNVEDSDIGQAVLSMVPDESTTSWLTTDANTATAVAGAAMSFSSNKKRKSSSPCTSASTVDVKGWRKKDKKRKDSITTIEECASKNSRKIEISESGRKSSSSSSSSSKKKNKKTKKKQKQDFFDDLFD